MTMRKISEVNSHESRKREGHMFMHRITIRDDKGQAFVELALILPVFILLLVGVAEFGRLAYAAIEVSNAARAGVAYGAQNHATAADTAGIQTVATQDAPNIIGLTAVATHACSCVTGATSTTITCSTAGTTCLSPSRIVLSVQVNTSAAVNTVFHFPGTPNTVTLSGQAIMRVEQ
jgi:Flp pilus assembly protein TadG